MALYCLPTLVFLVTEEPAVGFVAQCLRGAATMVVDVLAITALQRSVAADRLGRVFGAFDGLCLGAILVGSALIPLGIRLLGLDAMLWFTGLGVPVLCLLGLPAPRYRHHRLILAEGGRKLSKSTAATGLRELRAQGLTPSDIRRMAGLD